MAKKVYKFKVNDCAIVIATKKQVKIIDIKVKKATCIWHNENGISETNVHLITELSPCDNILWQHSKLI